MKFKFELGTKAKDKITGFVGVVVCRSQWLSNCNTYGLQPQELKDGKPMERQHFDEPQLTLVEDKKVMQPAQKTGGPERPVPSTHM